MRCYFEFSNYILSNLRAPPIVEEPVVLHLSLSSLLPDLLICVYVSATQTGRDRPQQSPYAFCPVLLSRMRAWQSNMVTRRRSFLLCVLLVILVALLGASHGLSKDDLIDATFTLPLLQYEDDPEFLDSLRARAQPVLLKDTLAQTSWAALKLWPPVESDSADFYLSRVSTKSVGVKRHTEPKFAIGCCPLKPMKQKDFWKSLTSLPEGAFMYFNADIQLLDEILRQDLAPPFFEETLANEWANTDERRVITNVWIGSKGSTASLHHDPFDNLFVQIHGTKRFTLFSPDHHHALYVYPKTNPSNRQAQVNIDAPNVDQFPRLSEAAHSGIEVVVHPGDVLYLPPFWFHQVTSLETAISVNTWFVSPEIEAMDAAWAETLPFNDQWSDEAFAVGVRVFIRELINKVVGNPADKLAKKEATATRFIKELVDSRFVPLYGPQAPVVADLMSHIASSDDPHIRVHLREQADLDSNTFMTSEAIGKLASSCRSIPESELYEAFPSWHSQLQRSTQSIAKHFRRAASLSGVQITHLEDFLEDIVGQTVGDKSVYHFLSACFLETSTEENEAGSLI